MRYLVQAEFKYDSLGPLRVTLGLWFAESELDLCSQFEAWCQRQRKEKKTIPVRMIAEPLQGKSTSGLPGPVISTVFNV